MTRAPFVAIVIALGLAPAAQVPQFKASTSLVRLEVSVTDERGAVRGLRYRDFVVEDSGARPPFRVEESADAPLDLVLVAQPLASVAYISAEQTGRVSAGLAAFIDQVQDRDRLGAIVAGAPPTRLRTLESGRPSFQASAFTGGEFAAPLDAIAAALREFDMADRRRALVAFTNAADFRSTMSFEALAEMARRLGPAFVLVGTPVKIEDQSHVRAVFGPGDAILGDAVAAVSGTVFPAKLQLLASRTGGIAVNLGSGDPRQLMAAMFTWLRTQYVIWYEPPAGKGWHPIRVTVNRGGAKVRTREGYVVD